MKVLDLFSGIGGFSLGLERAGMETVAFCEIEKYPQKVLAKHWPDVPIYDDVRKIHGISNPNERRLAQRRSHKKTAKVSRERRAHQRRSGINGRWVTGTCPDGKNRTVGPIDVITGGFPCQDISLAGNQAGIGEGTRSGLWSECARLLGEVRPRYAIFENVTALLSGDNGRWFQRVLWDISQVGYDAEWHCIPASELGAHHHRDRVWIICYPNNEGKPSSTINGKTRRLQEIPANTKSYRNKKFGQPSGRKNSTAPLRPEQPNELHSVDGRRMPNLSDSDCINVPWSQNPGIFGESGEGWEKLTAGCFCGFGDISAIKPTICRDSDGLPGKSHRNRLKSLGNSVVPQIPEIIGRAIMEAENHS